MNNIINALQAKGIVIPSPQQIYVEKDVQISNIQPGATLLPGVVLQGSKTMLGKDCILGPGGFYCNVRCGQGVKLGNGHYDNCVFLDEAKVRSGAEIRGGTLFMEAAEAAHTVGCKMTILGIKVVLGSLINFCDVFITGGTNEAFGFTEIGSGAVHYNFTPNGLKFGSLIGPGVEGEMFGLFPKTFLGGQTQIIAPIIIGDQVLIPAGTAVRSCIPSGFLSIEAPLKPSQKPYHPSMITSAKEKLYTTGILIAHYHALYLYFREVRNLFARKTRNLFLEKLLSEASDMILANIQERIHWIFDQKEQGKSADFFSKLPFSLELHKKELKKASGHFIPFHIRQIKEHQILLSHREILEQKFLSSCIINPMQKEFLKEMEKEISSSSYSQYLDFIVHLPEKTKRKGQKFLKSFVEKRMQDIDEIMKKTQYCAPVVIESKKYIQEFLPYFSRFQNLYKENKILFNGDFQSYHMGLLNGDLNTYTDLQIPAWQIFSIKPQAISSEMIEKLLDLLEQWPSPALINWPYLLSLAAQSKDFVCTRDMIKRSCYCFHGTDGLRGPTFVPEKPFTWKESLLYFLEKQQITPAFFYALARNTIRAFEIFYNQKIAAVLVGCDPRDIYGDDPRRKNIFYQSVLEGALSTGKDIYDLGIVPIPCIPYALAYCDCQKSPIQSSLAIYKSASHNPASQDGVKIFVKNIDKEGNGIYGKAPLELEFSIAAFLYKEALQEKQEKGKGTLHKAENIAKQILSNAMLETKNQPILKDIAFLAADLSHGAFSSPFYQKILQDTFQNIGIKNFCFAGNHPDGKNINSNEGHDRVGAAHLENIYKINRFDLEEGGKFFGFPALHNLMDFGKQNLERLKKGDTAWAILVDGDGDRSYVALYNPFEDNLHIIDGDEALFYQTSFLAQSQKFDLLNSIAFTVESSVPFINALFQNLKKYKPVQLLLSEENSIALDKINFKLCPVGDKHILQQQCIGAESSGHIVRPYHLLAHDRKTTHQVYTGNGILSSLYTISAIISYLDGKKESSFQENFQELLCPYTMPYNDLVYIYFINKKLWYRNSKLWNEIHSFLVETCKPHVLQEVFFEEEKDTLYFLCMEEPEKIAFSILARPSGTENKFGIKFFGDSTKTAFFSQATESLFPQVAQSMKDPKNLYYQEEQKILHYLLERKQQAISLEELRNFLNFSPTGPENARFMMIVEAISEKCQKMASYNGISLKILPRGENFLQLTSL